MLRLITHELLEWFTILAVLVGVAVGVAVFVAAWFALLPLRVVRPVEVRNEGNALENCHMPFTNRENVRRAA